MESRRSPYGPLHALLAGAVLVSAVFANGFTAFWHQFLYGQAVTMTVRTALMGFLMMACLFGALLLILWISTFFTKAPAWKQDGTEDDASAPPVRPNRRDAVKLAVFGALPVFLVAFGLNWACAHALEWLTGHALADQDLVKCLMASKEPLGLRAALCLVVLLAAPLTEEPLFRGIVFRGLLPVLPPWGAMALSGFVFAFVHVNAATFIPLWYLGAVFAWMYWKTGTILAPMTLHMLFNGVNLFLLFVFPDAAA
ncbi:MAG: lysostaphin resistance A-like protein [Kiritimatiellia bacterium]